MYCDLINIAQNGGVKNEINASVKYYTNIELFQLLDQDKDINSLLKDYHEINIKDYLSSLKINRSDLEINKNFIFRLFFWITFKYFSELIHLIKDNPKINIDGDFLAKLDVYATYDFMLDGKCTAGNILEKNYQDLYYKLKLLFDVFETYFKCSYFPDIPNIRYYLTTELIHTIDNGLQIIKNDITSQVELKL